MNIKLLRKIQRQILKEPRQFEMSWWFTSRPDIPNCGTAACIAGWTIALSKKQTPEQACNLYVERRQAAAAEFLRISNGQACRLFHQSKWPIKFQLNFGKSCNSDAKIAVKRIHHFIKTKGAE